MDVVADAPHQASTTVAFTKYVPINGLRRADLKRTLRDAIPDYSENAVSASELPLESWKIWSEVQNASQESKSQKQ